MFFYFGDRQFQIGKIVFFESFYLLLISYILDIFYTFTANITPNNIAYGRLLYIFFTCYVFCCNMNEIYL